MANPPAEKRMQMLYGVNQADQCADFAIGPDRERIWERLRAVDTKIIRLFLFDKAAPDPVMQWPVFVQYVQAVLNVGATPMITFAKVHRPIDDPRAIRSFANQSADVVWNCVEQWGGDVVRDWFWCVFNEPNNEWISGKVTFEQYRHIYEEITHRALPWLEPYLKGRKPRFGGPAIEGFQPFWWDWAFRFVDEIDNRLIGFLDWHRYADWRNCGEAGAPADEAAFERLLLSNAPDFGFRAQAIGKLVHGRDILNICGELNTHSHYTEPVRSKFNHSIFGATFYVAALLQLMRTDVYAEMFWTGNETGGGYGMMNRHGDPWPVYHAKKLCAQHIRTGDWISFPLDDNPVSGVDVVQARADGRASALIVHLEDTPATYEVRALTSAPADYKWFLKIDRSTDNCVASAPYDGKIHFDGYGVAVVTTEGFKRGTG